MAAKKFDKIDAGNIVKAAHNSKKKTMEVHFTGGDKVTYENITATAYKDFMKTFDPKNAHSPQLHLRAMVSRQRHPELAGKE